MSSALQRMRVLATWFAVIGPLGACSSKKQAPEPQEGAKAEKAEELQLEPTPGDAVIDGCLSEYPKSGSLGGGIDPQRAWKICMVQSGQQSGLCDPANMLPLSTAVCIARGKGLPMAAQWRVRLEFAPAPVPRVLWRLGLADESAHTLVDAHTGESVALRKKGTELDEPLLLDAASPEPTPPKTPE